MANMRWDGSTFWVHIDGKWHDVGGELLGVLSDIHGLTLTDGGFLVGDGSTVVVETGATARSSLGLGSAAVENIGTSGDSVPKLNAANTWSGGTQQFDSGAQWGTFDSAGDDGKFANGSSGVLDSSRGTTGGLPHLRFYNPNGQVGGISTSGSATSFNTSSDGQMKENRAALRSEVDVSTLIKSLSVQAFDWRDTRGRPIGKRGHGLIAQELHAVVPDAVTPGSGAPGEQDYQPWSVDYSKLVPYLIAALQEAFERIEVLEAKAA